MGERDSHPGGLGNALNLEVMSHETQTHSLVRRLGLRAALSGGAGLTGGGGAGLQARGTPGLCPVCLCCPTFPPICSDPQQFECLGWVRWAEHERAGQWPSWPRPWAVASLNPSRRPSFPPIAQTEQDWLGGAWQRAEGGFQGRWRDGKMPLCLGGKRNDL